jgi:hypothetical protein
LTWRIFSHYKCKFHFWIKFYFQWSSQIYMIQFMNYSIPIGIICSFVLFPNQTNWDKTKCRQLAAYLNFLTWNAYIN